PPAKLLEAIKELNEGGAPMSSEIARKVVAAFTSSTASNTATQPDDLRSLTKRETEILELLSRGMMYKEIALALELSVETIRKHVYHIYDKLHVSNRV